MTALAGITRSATHEVETLVYGPGLTAVTVALEGLGFAREGRCHWGLFRLFVKTLVTYEFQN